VRWIKRIEREAMADKQFVAMSRIEFADRFEGQVFHVGTHEDCKKVQDMIPAVMVKGDEQLISTAICAIPMPDSYELEPGVLYTWKKEAEVVSEGT